MGVDGAAGEPPQVATATLPARTTKRKHLALIRFILCTLLVTSPLLE